jgi:hypothetical protein
MISSRRLAAAGFSNNGTDKTNLVAIDGAGAEESDIGRS